LFFGLLFFLAEVDELAALCFSPENLVFICLLEIFLFVFISIFY